MRLGFALLMFSFVHASGSASAEFSELPPGSTIKLRKGAYTLPAKATKLTFFTVGKDTDGDGVFDHWDWCPRTPSGARVWTRATLGKAGKPWFVGCSGTSEPRWIYTPDRMDLVPPAGIQTEFELVGLSSNVERKVDTSTVFTVLDRKDPSIKKEDRENLLRGAFGLFPSYLGNSQGVLVKAPDGSPYSIRITALIYHTQCELEGSQRKCKTEPSYFRSLTEAGVPTVEFVEHFLSIKKGIEIPPKENPTPLVPPPPT